MDKNFDSLFVLRYWTGWNVGLLLTAEQTWPQGESLRRGKINAKKNVSVTRKRQQGKICDPMLLMYILEKAVRCGVNKSKRGVNKCALKWNKLFTADTWSQCRVAPSNSRTCSFQCHFLRHQMQCITLYWALLSFRVMIFGKPKLPNLTWHIPKIFRHTLSGKSCYSTLSERSLCLQILPKIGFENFSADEIIY